jgi:hypothetical protein
MLLARKISYRLSNYSILIFIFAGLLTFNSCSDNGTATGPDDEEIEVSEVVIEPQNVTFGVGEQQEFSAFLISATGDTVNDEFEVEWNWFSSDQDVFTVEAGGTATGHNPGEAFCIVEAETVSEKMKSAMKFVPIGLDSASVTLLN